MKTRVVTFRFRIPAWFPSTQYWRRVVVTWKTLLHKLRPYKCFDCGKTIDYRFPNFHYRGEGKAPVLLHLSGHKMIPWDSRFGVCGDCTAERIRKLFARIRPLKDDEHNGMYLTGTRELKCDVCGEVKPTLSVSWDEQCNIRFGSAWWNGHHICEHCLTEAAKFGQPDAGHSEWFSGGHRHHMEPMSGTAVGLKHWWSLLFNKRKETDENKVTVTTGS